MIIVTLCILTLSLLLIWTNIQSLGCKAYFSLRWKNVIYLLFLNDEEVGKLGFFTLCHIFPFKLIGNLMSGCKV